MWELGVRAAGRDRPRQTPRPAARAAEKLDSEASLASGLATLPVQTCWRQPVTGENGTRIRRVTCPAPADPRDTALPSKTCLSPWPGLARGTVLAVPWRSETQPGLAARSHAHGDSAEGQAAPGGGHYAHMQTHRHTHKCADEQPRTRTPTGARSHAPRAFHSLTGLGSPEPAPRESSARSVWRGGQTPPQR